MFIPPTYEKISLGNGVVSDKRGVPLGIGSAFAAIPPLPPLTVDQRPHDPRYLWDPAATLHALHAPAPPTLGNFGTVPSLELPHLIGGGRLGTTPFGHSPEITAPHPTYRIPPYMEHLYQTLHTSPQASLRGISPLERTSLSLGSDYLGMSGLAATRLSDPHLIPSTLTSADLAFSIDGSRLVSPRPSLRQSRKRALSSSPYSDSFDINSMIRFSPSSLVSIMNGSRSSSASGSYGHLSAGAISPVLGITPCAVMGSAASQLQQLQAHLMRGAALPASPFLPPSPLLQHSPSSLPHHQGLFPFNSLPQAPQISLKPECEKKDLIRTISPREDEKAKKDHNVSIASSVRNGLTTTPSGPPSGAVPVGASEGGTGIGMTVLGADDDNLKEEPDDFIETNCNWKGCTKEFATQDELVKHINSDHIHANKKSFVCRWKDCSREEKPFKAQYMLVVHMRRHTGEKPHRCTFEGCFKAYSRLENLKTHLRSHTGEKPYMCEYPGCTKAFSNASDRAKHQNRTHSNEKPYICKAPGCTKRYTDPSSLRKHVKTVHGADFYASKKHKGNDHQSPNSGSGGNDAKEGGPNNRDESPRSEGGKGGVLSSPSDPTSPGQDHSPSMIVGGVLPMDQSRLLDGPISDNNVSTTHNGGYEPVFPDDWDAIIDDELEAHIDLPMGMSSMNGPTGIGTQEHNLRTRLRSRLQAKGLANILPNIPVAPRRSSGSGVGELSQRITDLKMSGQVTPQQSRKNFGQSVSNRRDSNSTVSTYYGSMRSDSSHPVSRRGSELSQLSNISPAGRHLMAPSLYDPISCGSSRRSSENSNYSSMIGINPRTHSQMAKFQKRGFVNQEGLNTSNLVVQTQNMSLSQESLHNQQFSSGMSNYGAGTPLSVDNGCFGYMGPLGPPSMHRNREGPRRASDPIKPLERGFLDNGNRMQRFGSYSNFNCRQQMGLGAQLKVSNFNQPIQGHQLEEVGEDDQIGKVMQGDETFNNLNVATANGDAKSDKDNQSQPPGTPTSVYSQQQMSSPLYSQNNNNLSSSLYPNQNVCSTYSAQSMPSPASGYPYPQTSPGFSVPSPVYGTGYNSQQLPQQNQQFNNSVVSPVSTPVYNQMSSVYSQGTNSCYYPQQHQMQQNQQNFQGHQYSQPFGHYNQHVSPHSQQQMGLYNPMLPHQQRYSNICNTQSNSPLYGVGSETYGPLHICGHLAPPNLSQVAYQSPCNGCETSGNSGIGDVNQYPAWASGQMNQVYGNHYYNQNIMTHQFGFAYQENGQYSNAILGPSFRGSVASDVQCKDVSQSSQSRSSKSKSKSVTKQVQEAVSDTAKKANEQVEEKVIKPKPEEVLPTDTKPVDTKFETKSSTNKCFMLSDTYKRTLEYVQQCQNWKSVKEEVTSTTDQKPKLDMNGSVVGYNKVSQPNPAADEVRIEVPGTVPDGANFTSSTFELLHTRFATPLPPPISESANMVINDLTSSLNSLQEENRYLQILQ